MPAGTDGQPSIRDRERGPAFVHRHRGWRRAYCFSSHVVVMEAISKHLSDCDGSRPLSIKATRSIIRHLDGVDLGSSPVGQKLLNELV